MSGYRGDDRHGIKFRISEQILIIIRGSRGGIPPAHRSQTRVVEIANQAKLRRFVFRKVAQQIRAPISAPDYANCRCCHRLERIALIPAKVNWDFIHWQQRALRSESHYYLFAIVLATD